MSTSHSYEEVLHFIRSEQCNVSALPGTEPLCIVGARNQNISDESIQRRLEGETNQRYSTIEQSHGMKAVRILINEKASLSKLQEAELLNEVNRKWALAQKGNITVVAYGAAPDYTFNQVILPTVMHNPHVPTINGLPKEAFKRVCERQEHDPLTVREAREMAITETLGVKEKQRKENLDSIAKKQAELYYKWTNLRASRDSYGIIGRLPIVRLYYYWKEAPLRAERATLERDEARLKKEARLAVAKKLTGAELVSVEKRANQIVQARRESVSHEFRVGHQSPLDNRVIRTTEKSRKVEELGNFSDKGVTPMHKADAPEHESIRKDRKR